jgi:hypothetical protein
VERQINDSLDLGLYELYLAHEKKMVISGKKSKGPQTPATVALATTNITSALSSFYIK